MASWRENDWMGDGLDPEILPFGTIKLLKGVGRGAWGLHGEGLSNFVIEMKQEIPMTKAA